MDARWLRRTKDTLAVEEGVSSEVVARETGHSLHVARNHYIERGAETTARAAAMDDATRAGTDKKDSSTSAAKVAK
jgi:acyl-CoA reductase-like NAD-dependent aldehyde dehydrogenase